MKDYSSLDNLGCRMLDLKPYLKKAYDEGYAQGIIDGQEQLLEHFISIMLEGDSKYAEEYLKKCSKAN